MELFLLVLVWIVGFSESHGIGSSPPALTESLRHSIDC
jgi:hypothetical protein